MNPVTTHLRNPPRSSYCLTGSFYRLLFATRLNLPIDDLPSRERSLKFEVDKLHRVEQPNLIFCLQAPARFDCKSVTTVQTRKTSTMSTHLEPTAEEAIILFQELEKKFPTATLGENRWYLIAVRHPRVLF